MYLELTAPLGVLGFSRPTLSEGATIEFEPTVSVFDHCAASVVVTGVQAEAGLDALRQNRFVEDITFVSENESGTIYSLRWGETLPDLLTSFRETGGTVLSAIAVDGTWTFEVRFSEQGVSRFYARSRDVEHPISIQRVCWDAATRPSQNAVLTEKQRTVLLYALDAGYFDVPRGATMVDLAREFDISDTAVSQRLRRGLTAVLRNTASTTRNAARATVRDD